MGEAIKGSDPAASEVADENTVAENAEVAGCPDDSPGRVEPGTMFEMADVMPGGGENFDIAVAFAGDIIVACSILLGISDKETSTDILNVEGCETVGNVLGT